MAGVIPTNSLPNPIPDGLVAACESALIAAGFSPLMSFAPDGVHVSDVATVNATMASYVGSAGQLAFNKAQKQAALDVLFDGNFDLSAFIKSGTSTAITAANVGTFLATITNNYRSLRAQIANASTLAILNAININSGWPSNP